MININQFHTQGVTMFHFLSYAECQTLLNELLNHPLSRAPRSKGRSIEQDFFEADFIIDEYPKTRTKLFEIQKKIIDAGLLSVHNPFNRFRIQRYVEGSSGISCHQDGKRFFGPIVIFVLRAGGDLFIYKTIDDEHPVVIPATVGSCIIINNTVIHAVKDIKQERYTITQRVDTTPEKPL